MGESYAGGGEKSQTRSQKTEWGRVHRYLLHNDDVCEATSRGLGPGQVGLLSGWGVFSTIRIYSGVMFAWERHWRRLENDARRMRVPSPAEADGLEERLYRLLQAEQARD